MKRRSKVLSKAAQRSLETPRRKSVSNRMVKAMQNFNSDISEAQKSLNGVESKLEDCYAALEDEFGEKSQETELALEAHELLIELKKKFEELKKIS